MFSSSSSPTPPLPPTPPPPLPPSFPFGTFPSPLLYPSSSFPLSLLLLSPSPPLSLPPHLSLPSSHAVDSGEHSSWSGAAKDWLRPHHIRCSLLSEKRWGWRWRLVLCVCHMCRSSYAEGIEGLYSKELGIRYTEFEHIVVGHVRSCEVMWASCDSYVGIMWGREHHVWAICGEHSIAAAISLAISTDWAGLAVHYLCLQGILRGLTWRTKVCHFDWQWGRVKVRVTPYDLSTLTFHPWRWDSLIHFRGAKVGLCLVQLYVKYGKEPLHWVLYCQCFS